MGFWGGMVGFAQGEVKFLPAIPKTKFDAPVSSSLRFVIRRCHK